MRPPSTWKSVERRLAAVYGARRIALSGSNNSQGNTRSDTDHARLYIEVKTGKRWRGLGALWDTVRAQATKEGKVPVLIINPLRSRAPLACITVGRHAALERVAAAARAETSGWVRDPQSKQPLQEAIEDLADLEAAP